MSRLSSARSGIPSRGQRCKSLGTRGRFRYLNIIQPRDPTKSPYGPRKTWREGDPVIRTKHSCVRMSVFEREWIKATIEKRRLA